MNSKKDQKTEKPKYLQIIDFNDEKINVLLLGTSGCGKSTLINSILGSDVARTGIGDAVTDSISVYENASVPFRMIDTVGYEYGFLRQAKIRNDLARFCKAGVKRKELDKLIHMIWFCIDGTTKRIDQKVLDYLKSIIADWKDVPIIIVFTKSYSKLEVAENIEMARSAVYAYNKRHPKRPLNIVDIIPVVAKEYYINETNMIPPKGLDVLIARTNELAPDAKRLANKAIKEIDIKLKGNISNAMIVGATVAAAAVGAAQLKVPDAPVLLGIQNRMMKGMANTYDVNDDLVTNSIIDTILGIGAPALIGKQLVALIKNIPGINLVGSVINAVVAGAVTFSTGEVCKVMLEKIYSGTLDGKSADYEKEIKELFEKYMPTIMKNIEEYLKNHKGAFTLDDVLQFVYQLIAKTN